MTVLMWALCITGPKHIRIAPGRADLCDKQWSGWPVTATGEFHKKKVYELIKDNERITQREAATKLGILQECVDHIIYVLQYWRVCLMGSSYADGTDESFKNWNLPATFVTLWEWRWGISSKYYDSWQNVGASLWTWNQASVHYKASPAKLKIQNPGLGRKNQGYSFGRLVVYSHRLPWRWDHHQWEWYTATLKTLKQQLRRAQKHKKTLLQHDNTRPHTSQTTLVASEKLDLTI